MRSLACPAFGIAVLLASGVGGCVDANHRLTIDDSVHLAAFTADADGVFENDGPSLESVQRSEWEPVTFHVPSDGVIHRPTYRTRWAPDETLPRNRGVFPTATTAFDLGKSGSENQIVEALIEPFNRLGNVVAMPFLLFAEPQSVEMTSPYRRYERQPLGSVRPVPTACCTETCCGEAGCTSACCAGEIDAIAETSDE